MTWRFLLKPNVPAFVVALALAGSTAAAITYIHRLHSLTAAIFTSNVASLRAAEELVLALRDTRSALFHYAKWGNENVLEDLPDHERDVEKWLPRAWETAITPEEQGYMRAVEQGYREYAEGLARLQGIADITQREDAAERLSDLLTEKVLPPCHKFLDLNERSIEEAVAMHHGITVRLQWIVMSAGCLIPLAGVLLGYLLSQSVTRQLASSREALLRSEQLAAVGRLAAGMAHELRNPLTSIKMMVQTATPEEPADLDVVEDEVRRMERTIQACLDFAKRPQPQRSCFDLREAVAEACRLVEGRVRRQRLEMAVDQPEGCLLVSADRQQLHQVLVNLLLNAIESVPPRGKLGVAARKHPASEQVTLYVWDNGPGLPAQLLPTIFDPFVSNKATGTGLGLSISKQIVEGHGGRIEACNRPEGGAAFIITLPCNGGPRHADAAGRGRRTQHSELFSQGLPVG